MKVNASSVIRWAGLAAIATGLLFIVIQPLHPADVLPSVGTSLWIGVHAMGVAMGLFGILGVTGLYARQANAAGWLGVIGYLLFVTFWAFTLVFQLIEFAVTPLLVTLAPEFVAGFLGIVTSTPSTVSLGTLPMIYAVTGGLYTLGGLVFGFAIFRAGVLPRWAGVLLAAGAVAPVALTMLPHPLDRTFAVPMGLALIWLGYALFSERRAAVAHSAPAITSSAMRPA